MTTFKSFPLDNDRCWICGYEKLEEEVKHVPYPLCTWCSHSGGLEDKLSTKEMIEYVISEVEKHLRDGNLIQCENIDELSFIADIGDLGARHPYIKQFTSMIGIMAVQVALEKKYTPKRLLQVAQGLTPEGKWQRVYECLSFLADVGLLERGEGRYIYERFRPSKTLLDIAPSIEAVSRVDKEMPPRISNCIAGYALLRGIEISINQLRRNDKNLMGILRLYPKSHGGKLWVPKRFTAPTMFVLGHIAHGYSEFSENDLRTWLSLRKISWEDATWIINWLNRAIPSVHRLVDPKFDGINYHFIINRNYVRMRERYRARRRALLT